MLMHAKNTNDTYSQNKYVGYASLYEIIFPGSKNMGTRDRLVLFNPFAELTEDINYVMNYLGDVPRLYSKEFTENDVSHFDRNLKGLCSYSCQNFLN